MRGPHFDQMEGNLPVKTNAEHPIVPERGNKEVLIFSALAKGSKRSITQGDLTNPASVPVCKGFWGRVPSTKSSPLGQDKL